MQTHNLQDLQKVHVRYEHVGHYWPGCRSFTTLTKPDPKPFNPTLDDVLDLTLRKYVETVSYHRQKINFEMKQIYKKPIYFEEKKLSYMIYTIKDLIAISGKDVRNAIRDLRRYLGYPCYFYRFKGSKQVPVDPGKIVQAYKMMLENKSFLEIENILFL